MSDPKICIRQHMNFKGRGAIHFLLYFFNCAA
nr:MAG TPA: hypothetical protein [Caudoviricetes sp.]